MSGATEHLWEVDHSYHCNDANYYSNECVFQFKSWADFLAEMGDADFDYNLIFRWDWKEEAENGLLNYKGDDNYRNGVLKIYTMQQRKGRFTISHIEVCRADEAAVIEYLKPRRDYLFALWEPITKDAP